MADDPNALVTAVYNNAKLQGDSDTLAFQKAQAAMQQAMAQTNSFGWAAGGNWTDMNSLAANMPPAGTPTLAAGEAMGSTGYIPGFTGVNAGQTMSQLSGAQTMAGNAAGMTGYYAAPRQSAYTPGTFVKLDPSTYDHNTYGDQVSYVLPSGQLQRVSTTQAKAMGWNGSLTDLPTISASQAQMLEMAPPQNAPQQTLQGLSQYSSLNSAALNNAIAQSGATGMYQAPATIQPPGTNWGGQQFQNLDQQTQQNYFLSNGGDWNAAMNKWVADSNAAYQAAGGQAPGAAPAQETLAAQNQYFTQANNLATQYGQYYAPSAPGQTAQAGVNAPQAGQLTQSMQQQQYNQWLQAQQQAEKQWTDQQSASQAYMSMMSQLRGPADWAQYQKVLGATPQGTTDLVKAAAGQYVPGTGATTGVQPQAANMNTFYNQLTGSQTQPDQSGQQQLSQMQNTLVAPNQMAPQTWNALQPSQQQMLLGVWESQGYNKDDAQNLFKQSLPKYATSAPSSGGSFRLQ